jgi:hypothetical protein
LVLVSQGVLHWGPRPLNWAFVLWGAWIAGMAVDALDHFQERLVPLAIAALLLGAIVCRGGLVDRLLARRRRALAAQHPEAPWVAVPYWKNGVVGLPVWRRCGLAGGSLVIGMAICAWALFSRVWPPDSIGYVIGSLAGLWSVVWAYRFQNVVFQGETEVRLRAIPLRSRGDVVIDFAVGRRGADFEHIHFALLRIVEVEGVGGTPTFVGYSHRGEYELPRDQPPPAPGEQVEVHFALPRDASGTDLARGRPVYWLLEVSGDTSSGFYTERFPVPIYDA